MTTPSRVFIAAEVVVMLRAQRNPSRQALNRFIEELVVNSFHPGDYVESDGLGRPIQVAIIGRSAICYWADHAVREVKVLDLKAAGN